jgi:hypothetical protein
MMEDEAFKRVLMAKLQGKEVEQHYFGVKTPEFVKAFDPTDKNSVVGSVTAPIINTVTDWVSDGWNSLGGMDGTIKAAYEFIKGIGGSIDLKSMFGNPVGVLEDAFSKVIDEWVSPKMDGIFENIVGGMYQGGLVGGDSPLNDRIMAMLSPGEFVIPRTTVSDIVANGGVGSAQGGAGGTTQNISVTISVSAGANVSEGTIRREIVPKLVEELRKMSQNGAQVLSKRGVY